MAAMSRGPVAKLRAPKKLKGGTPSSRRHHFESFSQRIAKLKIEPIRRGRSTILDDAELDTTFSYFRDALAEWRDINISKDFSKFARQVAPLCDSLPQVLHHSHRILELLVEYIEKGDRYSEEPLLSLMAHFAHDLGARFEQHFERAVKTVSQLAAKHPAVEVIEWSFTCLAWLFKYLSRLLVPDLRPVFDLMAPLLGRQHQKLFVTRFAAESLSFLIRKAGAVHHRDKAPLRMLIKHVAEQLNGMQGSGLDIEFQQGLMALFADSMKGVQRGLHSSAAVILEELLAVVYEDEYIHFRTPPLEPILVGALTSVIHHSDAEHFQPLVEVVLLQIKDISTDIRHLGLSSRLMFVVCGVRKGSRVADWSQILEALNLLLDGTEVATALDHSSVWDFLAFLSVSFQYCPLDAAIPHAQSVERLCQGLWEQFFLPFCNMFADMGMERFNTLVLPYFKRFIAQKAHTHGDDLLSLLRNLHRNKGLPKGSLQPSIPWQNAIAEQFRQLTSPDREKRVHIRAAYPCNSFLGAIHGLILAQETKESVSNTLFEILVSALAVSEEASACSIDILAAGNGFGFLVKQSDFFKPLADLWPALCSATAIYGQYLPFWDGLLSLAKEETSILSLDGSHVQVFRKALMRCLSSPTHELRLVALELLQTIVGENEQARNVISTATLIEQTPINLETQRSISMRVGQIARMYSKVAMDEWLAEAIPTFCFGLLHVKLASVWEDACSALKTICDTKEGEAIVSHIAFDLLRQSVSQDSFASQETEASVPPRHATEFECTNVIQLQRAAAGTQAHIESCEEQLQSLFDAEHAKLPYVSTFSRMQALRVLNAMPGVAEKRSRLLVPILLDWGLDQGATATSEDDMSGGEIAEQDYSHWARKDQKAMLSLFAKFTNPKVLYRSAEVYDALLFLLSNGDSDIQSAALKAIFTWKEPAITDYQENLSHLLDDARFRDEISVFLDVGTEQSLVKEEHRTRLLPVILRLLYGKVISGKGGLEAKRKAVFQVLTRFEERAIQDFLKIALGSLSGIQLITDGGLDENILKEDLIAPRKQVGLLNMVDDMLSTLKTTFRPHVGSILDPVLYCLISSSRKLALSPKEESESSQEAHTSMLKTIRQRSLYCLVTLFDNCPDFSWSAYAPFIVKELVDPRIEQFPIETAQAVSGLLRLFSAWAKSVLTAPFLVEYNSKILVKIVECLGVPSAKDEVKHFVLDNVLRTLISLLKEEPNASTTAKLLRNKIYSTILQPYSEIILAQVGDLLRRNPSRDVLESGVQTVAELAPHVVSSGESRSMIEISAFLLKQPSKRVNSPTKLGLLKILHEFIPRCDGQDLAELVEVSFNAICPLFSHSQDRQARSILCEILTDLSVHRDDLSPVAKLCHDINAFSTSRLDEPDFDRRSSAFDIINGETLGSFSVEQWKPIVYNMLFFIKDSEELSIRVSASLALRRFIQASTGDKAFKSFLSAAVVPGMQTGMRETSELVRAEFLAVLAQLVQTYKDWSPVADLFALLSVDEETSFYNNILHIQAHRRLRALRRLSSQWLQLQSSNIYHMLLPLLEHFVFNKADDEGANSLAGETIRSISILSQGLEWPQFRSLLKRYIDYLKSKEDLQKIVIKLVVGLMDSLNVAGRTKGYATVTSDDNPRQTLEVPDEENMELDNPASALSRTLPQQEKLTKDLINNILPELLEFLRKKDESNVSLRVPVATAVTKVLLVLPQSEIEARLPSVLLDICHILRSRAQDSRDMSRNTLGEIATFTGPAYLGFILKALRTALQRGYQLHVLSFTLHSILVKLSEHVKPGDLDYCLADIVDVIMDDTFGMTGQEKDAEDYISKMKEVKSSKSFDSMDIIARCATPAHLVELVLPIKSLLGEKLNARAVQKIDELLRRIGLGMLQNPTVKSRDILVFCYELIQESYKADNQEEAPRIDPRNRKYLINMKGAAKSGARASTTTYTYKLIRFSLDILRTVLRKHEDLQTPQNVAGFLPSLGDALVAGHEEIQISAIRLLTAIIKVPMPELDENCPIYVTEAVRTIKGSPSSNTEIAQASLKFITAVLRERSSVKVNEQHLAHLLKRILPDLDEPDRQGVTFGFLKAVMNRQIVIAEVYEVMDKVAVMMVTNQTRSARDLARSSYFHFLMEYPQARNRFKKQLGFLLKNLQYDYVEGRQSVMEALNLVFAKVGDDVLQDQLSLMFIPLVHSMANDDSSDCRTMAGALVKKLFERADSQRLKSFTDDLRSWLEQDEDAGLKRLSIQCWGLYLEVADVKPKELGFVLEQLQLLVTDCNKRRDDDDWELIYYSLTVFSKLCKAFPDNTLSSSMDGFWIAVRSCVSYPHAWVKLTAAKLIGTLFAEFASTNGDSGLDALPLEGSRGLQLTEENMIILTNAFLKNLSIPNVSEDLCAQSVRNLAFLARCLAANGSMWSGHKIDDDDEVEDAFPQEEPVDATNGDAEPSDEEWGGFSPPPESLKPKKATQPQTAIHRLIVRLSGLIRRETKIMKPSALWPKSATTSLLETLTNKLPIPSLSPSLSHLLTTLSTLTDPATTIPRSTDPAFNDTYRALIEKAREIMNILQQRMGTQEYLKVMGEVHKGVKQRRDDRRMKRKVEAVAEPEKWGREKKRRNEVKKVKRKERSAEYKGKRRGW